jgi:hypothetical protein
MPSLSANTWLQSFSKSMTTILVALFIEFGRVLGAFAPFSTEKCGMLPHFKHGICYILFLLETCRFQSSAKLVLLLYPAFRHELPALLNKSILKGTFLAVRAVL